MSVSSRGPRSFSTSRTVRKGCHAVVLCWLMGVGPAAFAAIGPMDFVLLGQARPERVAGQTSPVSWRVGEYSALRLVDAEPGAAANDQPQVLLAERLQAALTSITTGAGNEVLFARDEAELLALALQKALAAAQPGQDVLLMSSQRRGRGLLAPQLTITARLFVREGQLHLLVHDDRLDVVDPYRQTRMLPALVFGSRSQASQTRLRIQGQAGPRNDWLSWSLATLQSGLPAGTAQAVAPAAAVSSPSTDAGVRSPEERLRLLKRLHEQGLISDDDYTHKRRQILTDL
jgi:Short C-terminal domain